MSEQPDPLVCAYCGNKNVYPCSDRVDDEWGGHNVTVLRCTYCGRDA